MGGWMPARPPGFAPRAAPGRGCPASTDGPCRAIMGWHLRHPVPTHARARGRTTLAPLGGLLMTEMLAPVKPGKLIINGEAVDAASGKTFTTLNPATEEPICAVAEAGADDVDRAVRAARAALETGPWSKMKPAERQRLLWKLAELIERDADEIAHLETLDNGKPIFESRQIDLGMVVNCFQYFAGWATKLAGETIPVNPAYF